ncbi:MULTISPECIES: DMT family transporter [Rhodobacterales]|jgi:drug/metabolite transporter (DMT)-like permease|uniref:DMT family transporter n=1 Tax=Rhodobacterales TaxID=204455 RepID=UPI00237FC2C8|nr:DMT family transporter [Phaeobacter gallaeciensis]MDE4060060.1 DMT family transporter [Phaeobacter gallaeciensis]MDE4096779.1 DMT family transporter [Phaeobacter gallaeciensis]MDE4105927.1 DMT family transporter [Phaeobacter gallaeciensis]MDE4110046.1 DMT family transporter [Phaeobacter gallaeciensis]MDE4114514.1 DMT family transporter [Phaeobacter gallaeciensis]
MSLQSRAILLMISAIFCFSVMDATVKALAPSVGVLPALWARYAGQMLLVLVIVMPRLKQVVRTRYPALQFLRSVLLMSATAFFFTGLSKIPLTDAAALMSTNPVLITLGAALFLGEALGVRRIAGIAVAMIGAMIVIRPGSDVFSPAALYPLAAACCYSGYALLTRRVGADEDVWTSLFYTGLVGTVLLSLAVPFQWQSPDLFGIGLMIIISLAGTIGQLALIQAFSKGEAAMLAPFSYSGLAFAAVWGFVFFSEVPDFWTIFGSVMIAGAGLYVWYRENYRKR